MKYEDGDNIKDEKESNDPGNKEKK